MKSLRTRAARGTLINTAFAAALGVLGLLESLILARFVSRSAYGLWGVLAVTLGTLLSLKQVGVGDKYLQQDEADQQLAFQRAFTLELAFTVALTLLLLASLPVIVLAYGLPKLIAPGLVVAVALLVSTWQAPQWVFYRRMDYTRQRALAAVDPVVGFAVSVALAVAGAGYWAFVGGLAAGACAASGAAVIKSPIRLRLRYEPGTLRSYARFSGPLLVASGASFVIAWSAMIAAKLDLGVAALGVVALAATIASFTERIDQLVTGTLYPAICAVRDNRQLLYESFVKSNRLALMWAVPFGFALTLFAPDLVRFGIGTRWRPAVVVLQVYGAAAALNHLGFNWTAYFRALGNTRPIAVAAVTAMAVFLAAGIPLLLIWGLPGFAVGVALQGLAALACRAYYLRSVFPGFDMLRHAARSLLPTLPGAALVLALRAVEGHSRTLTLALGELAVYALATITATWWSEASLLREAVGIVRGQDPAPAH